MRHFALPAVAAILAVAIAAAVWFAWSNYAAVRADFGGTPSVERL